MFQESSLRTTSWLQKSKFYIRFEEMVTKFGEVEKIIPLWHVDNYNMNAILLWSISPQG